MRGIIMETRSIKNKKYSKVTLAVIISVMMLSPVLSFGVPMPSPFGTNSQISEDLGKYLGPPKIINTYSKTTKTYSNDFWSLESRGLTNIQNKIIWKVNKDKIVDVYTNQRRIGSFIKPLGVIKDKARSDDQKLCMLFRYKYLLGSEENLKRLGFEAITSHQITIFKDGRSYLKRNAIYRK